MSLLPELVRLEGVVVMPVHAEHADVRQPLQHRSEDADETFLYNFANVHVSPELQRIPGLGA
jgi:HAE1 family hydrophobic/amphiphilic exporter-1